MVISWELKLRLKHSNLGNIVNGDAISCAIMKVGDNRVPNWNGGMLDQMRRVLHTR